MAKDTSARAMLDETYRSPERKLCEPVDVRAPEPEPSPCTGVAHTHRWIHFGRLGEKQTIDVEVTTDGKVVHTEDSFDRLLRIAGFTKADPDPVEDAATRRLDRARSRLQDGLNAALNRRAR